MAFSILTVFVLVQIWDSWLGIIPLVCLWVLYDYAKGLEKNVEKKTRRIGTITYFVTGILGLLVLFF